MIRISYLILLLIIVSCHQTAKKKNPSNEITSVAKTKSLNAAFLMINGVYNSELIAPFDIFQHTKFHTEGGIHVFTVSETMKTIKTFEGLSIQPDYSFDSPNLPEIDILIVPSAEHNMDSDLENKLLINWVS